MSLRWLRSLLKAAKCGSGTVCPHTADHRALDKFHSKEGESFQLSAAKPMHTCSKEKTICTLCPTWANESLTKKCVYIYLPCCKPAAVCTWPQACQLISKHLCFVKAFSWDVQPMVQTASSCQHCSACSPL